MQEIIAVEPTELLGQWELLGKRATTFGTVIGCVVLSGLPAGLLTVVWMLFRWSLHVAQIAGAKAGAVFGLAYLSGLVCLLPILGVVAGLRWLGSNGKYLIPRLTCSEQGLTTEYAPEAPDFIRRRNKWARRTIPWNELTAVASQTTWQSLERDYGVRCPSVCGTGWVSRLDLALGMSYICFVQGKKDGTVRVGCYVYPLLLSQQGRRQLLLAMQRFSPKTVITRSATERLLGMPLVGRNLRFTRLWLDVLNSERTHHRTDALVAGDRVGDGRYEVIERLPTGGQANVYLAGGGQAGPQHEHARVVLKEYVLAAVASDNSLSSLREFERESLIMQHLNSPRICRLLDTFVEDGRAYLVLEHIAGESLRALVERCGPLPAERVAGLARQICQALAHLHAQQPPVIHRDISPDNIIVAGTGDVVKLVDFSVAATGECDEIADVAGKPAYMSPDQFRGFTRRANDIYGLGATIFFMLTGSDPEPISQSRPSLLVDGLDPWLDDIVVRCTAVGSCDKHYDAVEDILLDLDLDLSEAAVEAAA